jgi:hypothetical protein
MVSIQKPTIQRLVADIDFVADKNTSKMWVCMFSDVCEPRLRVCEAYMSLIND